MTKRFFLFFVIVLGVALGASAQLKVGDTVLAFWSGDGKYYVATLVEVNNTVKGGGFLVIYRDGDNAVLPTAQIRPMRLGVGSKVEARWGGAFYPGTIGKIVGEAVYIVFDDGDKGWTSWAGIRIELK